MNSYNWFKEEQDRRKRARMERLNLFEKILVWSALCSFGFVAIAQASMLVMKLAKHWGH
jgi:hypothetical protein